MNKLYALIITLLFASMSYAQEQDCYEYYKDFFQARGAFKVKDSVHENVIISIRTVDEDGTPVTNCLYGKVVVKDEVVVRMYLQFVDNEYELYDPKFKSDYPMSIQSGISRTQVTLDDEMINVFFVKHIRPKKKNYKQAPLIKFE